MATKKFLIALKLKGRSYNSLLALGNSIVAGMATVPAYLNPNPGFGTVILHLQKLKICISLWGQKGNRGSHRSLLALRAARDQVFADLNGLAQFVSNATPNDVESWAKARFPIKSPGHKRGVLPAVRNLRHFIARNINDGTLKIKWDKPEGTSNLIIDFYIVMRSETSSYDDARQVGVTTRTSFVDKNPGKGCRFYWIMPYHASITGVVSDICVASARLLP